MNEPTLDQINQQTRMAAQQLRDAVACLEDALRQLRHADTSAQPTAAESRAASLLFKKESTHGKTPPDREWLHYRGVPLRDAAEFSAQYMNAVPANEVKPYTGPDTVPVTLNRDDMRRSRTATDLEAAVLKAQFEGVTIPSPRTEEERSGMMTAFGVGYRVALRDVTGSLVNEDDLLIQLSDPMDAESRQACITAYAAGFAEGTRHHHDWPPAPWFPYADHAIPPVAAVDDTPDAGVLHDEDPEARQQRVDATLKKIGYTDEELATGRRQHEAWKQRTAARMNPVVVPNVDDAERTGIDGKLWPDTVDGAAWARMFVRQFPSISMDDALGWFCNAIMRGVDSVQSVDTLPGGVYRTAETRNDHPSTPLQPHHVVETEDPRKLALLECGKVAMYRPFPHTSNHVICPVCRCVVTVRRDVTFTTKPERV